MNEVFSLLIAKILLSAAMVISITLIAERSSTRLAGVLLGFPLGAGLTFFFTGLEQGAVFAAESTVWTIQGLSATLFFCICYNKGRLIAGEKDTLSLLFATIFGVAGFFAMAFVLHDLLQDYFVIRVILITTLFAGCAIMFRRAPSPPIRQRVQTNLSILFFRAIFAALTIVVITAAASQVGPKWTGIFAAFPTTVLPSVLVLHYHYGGATVPAIFREIPFGLIAIVVFSIAVFLFFPIFGVFVGILLSYATAFVYLLLYELFLRSFLDRVIQNIWP